VVGTGLLWDVSVLCVWLQRLGVRAPVRADAANPAPKLRSPRGAEGRKRVPLYLRMQTQWDETVRPTHPPALGSASFAAQIAASISLIWGLMRLGYRN
jgi:hypothetical protein